MLLHIAVRLFFNKFFCWLVLVLYPYGVSVFGKFAIMQGGTFFSRGFVITERMDIGQ